MATFQTGFQSADDTLLVGTFLGKLKHRAEHREEASLPKMVRLREEACKA